MMTRLIKKVHVVKQTQQKQHIRSTTCKMQLNLLHIAYIEVTIILYYTLKYHTAKFPTITNSQEILN